MIEQYWDPTELVVRRITSSPYELNMVAKNFKKIRIEEPGYDPWDHDRKILYLQQLFHKCATTPVVYCSSGDSTYLVKGTNEFMTIREFMDSTLTFNEKAFVRGRDKEAAMVTSLPVIAARIANSEIQRIQVIRYGNLSLETIIKLFN